MSELEGKRAIVSGASQGIGRGIAIELARAGAEVVINHRDHPEDADEVVSMCQQVGGKAHAIRADMAVQSQVEDLVQRSHELMGGIDIVVSNAVYSDRHLMLDSDLAEFRTPIDVSMAMYGAEIGRRSLCETTARRSRPQSMYTATMRRSSRKA